MTRPRIRPRPGTSVRAVSHASGAPTATEASPTQKARTQAFQSAFCSAGSAPPLRQCVRVGPHSPPPLSDAIHPIGSAIRRTRASADAIQPGSERSTPCRRPVLMARSRAEELDEAALDLLVPLLELLGVDVQELEIGELRLVSRKIGRASCRERV